MKNSLPTKLMILSLGRMTSLRRSKCKRNTRKQNGGGAGNVVAFAPVQGGVMSNPLAWTSTSNCLAATRPGFLEGGYKGFHGLPGMTVPLIGGRRNTKKGKKSKKSKKNKQRGGAYSIGPYDGTVAGYPGGAGIGPIVNTGCSAPSQTAIPLSTSADNLNSRSSYLWTSPQPMRGGAVGSDLAEAAAPLTGSQPVGGASITVPTAGYTHLTDAGSIGATSAGTKFMVNVPADGRAGECMKGGSRKSKKSKSKKAKSKKSKKSRN